MVVSDIPTVMIDGVSAPAAFDSFHDIRGRRVLVLGDVMLDEYVYSRVRRISPEAAVPVAEVDAVRDSPGGAANVAANVAALGGEPVLVAVIGEDQAGERLSLAMKSSRVNTAELIRSPSRATPVKTRVIAGGEHLIRIDRERDSALGTWELKQCERRALAQLSAVQCVVLSDYAKGTLTTRLCRVVLEAAQERAIPVVADPKPPFGRFTGCTVLTPNMSELEAATAHSLRNAAQVDRAARRILRHTRAQAIVLKQSANGATVFLASGEAQEIPTTPVLLGDVTGAGDTFSAALALALPTRSVVAAARFAVTAASAVVRKPGTATVTFPEVVNVLQRRGQFGGKVVTLAQCADRLALLREAGCTVALTNGCFDLLHVGHLSTLEAASDQADILVVAINDDDGVRRLKGSGRPVMCAEDRASVIAALGLVDFVVVFAEPTAEAVIRALQPDVYVKGGDYAQTDIPEATLVHSMGSRVVYAGYVPDRSTTRSIGRLRRQSQTRSHDSAVS